MSRTSDLPVKATQTSIEIIEALIELDGAGVTDIASVVGRSKSSVHNHLETLTGLGFVVKTGHEYRVGLRFLRIGSQASTRYPLYRAGLGEVTQLVTASGFSAGLAVLEGDAVCCLHHHFDGHADTPYVAPGESLPAHCTAAGKAILAALDDSRREELLVDCEFEAFTPQSHTDRSELLTELQTVRSRGLAVEREEWKGDRRGIAAAVSGTDGDVCGAIYVVSDTDRMSGKRLQQDLPGLVISAANRIRNNLRTA